MIQKLMDTRAFVEESYTELQRVTWPDFEQLKNATFVIIVFSMIVALIILIMDFSSRTVMDLIFRIFGA